MDLTVIKALIESMAASDLSEMEVSENGWTLRLRRNAVTAPAPVRPAQPLPAPVVAAIRDLHAPLSGVVHLQSAPGTPPFVREGETIDAGAVLCVIEAMKVFNSVRAERAGVVSAILVASGTEVEAGQLLMRIA